jgi:hypothetical protein
MFIDDVHFRNYTLWATVLNIIFFIIVLVCAPKAHAEIPKTRAVNAIIGEAEGETYDGKLAVACAIRNRGTLQGVYGERSPRVTKHKYGAKVFVDAVRAWEESRYEANCAFICGAQHWQSEEDWKKHATWIDFCDATAKVGTQIFLRCP